MKINACYGHIVRLPSLIKYGIFILKGSNFLLCMWILSFFRRERSKFNFVLSCFVQLLFCIIFSLRYNRSRSTLINFFLNLSSCFQTISFKFYQHFLLHQMTIFISLFIIFLFKDNMIISQFL
jgi:hypothetical protein